MFRRLPEVAARTVSVAIDGRSYEVREGDSVAAALLAAGFDASGANSASGAPRGPYCMAGACFECLVTVDGVGSVQGCLVSVRDGMEIATQRGPRELPR